MAKLRIHLLEGFAHDDVVVRVGDTVVFEGTDISTRHQIGLAKAVELEVTDEPIEVAVELPRRHLLGKAHVAEPSQERVYANVTAAGTLDVASTREPLRLA